MHAVNSTMGQDTEASPNHAAETPIGSRCRSCSWLLIKEVLTHFSSITLCNRFPINSFNFN